ncbi:MAG: ABC transporter substrate-binding protein [Bacteriovorax sp.]|nr:ABC transporter substrate-binding protein [Bacteriovorax sp.]
MNKFILTCVLFLSALSVHAKSFVYCSEGSPSSFNPQLVTDGTSTNATAGVLYNGLVEFQIGTTKIVPALAESWEISKDKMTYTFKLRKGVKFHTTKYFTPTRDFNATDVLFSIDRQRLASHPFHLVSGGKYEYFDGMEMGKIIKEVKALDPYLVQITLSSPEAPFLANMAMSFMGILSEEYGAKLTAANKKADMDNFPVGTSAFIFQSYAKDSVIKYTSNPQYWGKHGNIDKLIFAITPDANVRHQKLKTGECQFVNEPSPADIPEMKKNPALTVMQDAGLNIGYLSMNVTKKPFDNLLVRQAINHALNKKSYIDAIYLGNAIIAKNPIPPTIWSYNDSVKDYEYSPEKAKALLAKAGLPNGFETEIWTLPVSRPYNPNGKKMGELMQADLAKVGIKVKLLTFDWPTYLKKASQGDQQMLQMGWTGDNGDPDNFLNTLLGCGAIKGGSNYSMWCDKKFNQAVVEAKTTPDMKKRSSLYKEAQKIFKEQAPWVTLAHSTVFKAMAKNIKGYKVDPLGHDSFNLVNVE